MKNKKEIVNENLSRVDYMVCDIYGLLRQFDSRGHGEISIPETIEALLTVAKSLNVKMQEKDLGIKFKD